MSSEPGGERVLAGLRILVTRPAHQSEKLCRLIEAEGGTALRLPLLTIEPTANPAVAQQRLAAEQDVWIFTSANAVRHAQALVNGPWARRIAALGPATAAAVAGLGHGTALTGLGTASGTVLELPEFQDVRGTRILIITGEHGLDVLERELAARGAAVTRAEVYRRVPLPYPPEAVVGALRKSDVVIITSGEALTHLLRITPEESRKLLLKKTLVVPSARVVEQARALGFTLAPRVVESMSDAALCAACAVPTEKA
jgi:uroporphyrinogen-III synthase